MIDMTTSEVLADQRRVLAAARAEFDPKVVYLNTATLGLPPARSLRALRQTLTGWQAGRASALDYDVALSAARTAYAALVGVAAERVAVGSQASVFAGL